MNVINFSFLLLLLFALLYGAYLGLRYASKFRAAEWGHPWINTISGLIQLFVTRYHRLQYEPINLPPEGGAIVVANHISGLDALLLIAASARPLRFLIAREEYERFGLTWIFKRAGCIPVERERRPEIALRQALRALREGEVVAIFPHGKIHLDSDPPRKLKGGALKLAQMSGCSIHPVRIEGVRAQGYTLLALPVPSKPVLYNKPEFFPTPGDYEHNLEKLSKILGEEHHRHTVP